MTKIFKQKVYDNSAQDLSFDGDFSKNILSTGEQNVVQLGIYATPGTKFLIGDDKTETKKGLIINGSGIFQMDTETNPIQSIQIAKNAFSKKMVPIIIDLVIEGGVING